MHRAFDSIMAGRKEALAHAKREKIRARIHRPEPIDVEAIRDKVGMSQTEFAAVFGFALATLRRWESGERQPHGAARVLLTAVSRKPKAVLSALSIPST